MTGAVLAGVPLEAAEAARETLGGALAAAAHLPGQAGVELVAAAQGAFIDGLQLAALISTVASIGLAIFTAVVLRRVRASGGAETEDDLEAARSRVGLVPAA